DPTNLSSASLPQSVTVTSTGSGLLAMGQVDLRADAQNFSLDPANNTCGNAALEPGSTCYFQVKFQPRSLGTHTGSVAIPNDAIGGAQLVTLNGQATAALAALSPPAVAIYQPLNGTASPATVTLTNNGSGLLEIKLITIKPGAFFSQSNNCPQFMPAQSSCQITVSLSQIGPSDTLAKAETLIVQDDAAGNPVSTETVPLTGNLAQPLTSFNRQELAFAQNVGTLSPPATFMLVNTGQVPLHLSDIHEDGDFSQTNNCPPVLAPGAGCAINVTFVPSTLGERDGYIVVVDDSLDSPHRIAITGVATVPSAQLGPGRLTFTSNVGVGTPAQSINLVNRGNGPLTIAGIATTGDFQAQPHCPSTLLPGIACSIGITFNPQGAGSRHGSLLVSDDSNGLPGSQQAVLLDGIAHLPVAALSTTSLTLAANLSGSVAQSITVSNTGDAPLNIRAIGISGPASGDYGQSTNCLGAVRPGGSCAVSVRFTPHGYGARGATLTIYDNGPGGAQSVVLNGTGTLPRPLLSATYLNFGGDRVGSPTAPQSIVLFNAGNGALAINGISASGVDFNMATTCGPRLDAGASCRITVTFLPRASGPRSGLVTVVDSAGSQQFTLSGVGT
ncbi:MAG: choice-of-anchor D domain-containing protein, partial [Chloroflexi bacterium]